MILQADMFPITSDERPMGLDMSLKGTGVVVLGPGHGPIVMSTTLGYSLPKGAILQEKLDRIINVTLGIRRILEEHKPTIVGIEGYAFSAKYGGEFLAELQGVVKVNLYQQYGKIPVVVPPATARKAVLGYGGQDKKRLKECWDKMVETNAVEGIDKVEDHNQFDAWVVAECIRRKRSG